MRKYIYLSIIVLLYLQTFSQPAITQNELKKHLFYLASDDLQGRKPGSEGDKKTGEYLVKEFTQSGLKALCDNGIQKFEVITSIKDGKDNNFWLNGVALLYKTDFSVLPFSSSAAMESSLICAGYGFDIHKDSLKWNDYQNIDVKGKWVLILRGDPEIEKMQSVYVPYSTERAKALTAKNKGAAGVIFVSGTLVDKEDQLIMINRNRVDASIGIPVLHIKKKLADELLKNTGKNIDDLEKELNSSKNSVSFDTKVIVKAQTDIILTKETTQNVVFIIEGSDKKLKNEYIVIGAHHDHLGMGGEGSRMPDTVAVHNGADDNASGTVSLLEIAQKMISVKNKLHRSVVFVAFGAEEMGLLGSKYFVNNCPVDVKNIKAMINLDMVGRLDSASKILIVGGTGTAKEIPELLKKCSKKYNFNLVQQPDGFGPSDHSSFYTANIPVFFINSGAHPDYHTPNDDTQKINFAGLETINNFVFDIAMDLINRPKNLEFIESAGKFETRQSRGFKVTLGVIPDFSGESTQGGMRIDGTKKGGPAEKAGLLKGDIISAVNGEAIQNIYDYTSMLGKLQPGQLITVDVIRNGKKITILVQL